jgi:hypothetical protein
MKLAATRLTIINGKLKERCSGIFVEKQQPTKGQSPDRK